MCKAASFIVTKNNVYYGNATNSHEEILKQHGIVENSNRTNIVRVEITPPNNDYSLPFKQWKYKVDQDRLPEWYVANVDEERVRKMLSKWYHDHIEMQHTDAPYQNQKGGNCSTQTAGYRSTQTAGYRSTQTAGKYSTQTAGDESTQTVGYSSTQKAGDESTQTAGDESTQTVGYSSTQKAGDESTQTAGEYSTQKAGNNSTQTAGIGTVQIIHWYDGNNNKQVSTRIITEKTVNKPYKFTNGKWRLVKE